MVGIPDVEAALRGLPARDVRRHGAARDDRHRPRLRARAAHRRRADDGARRDHPGPDPRPHAHAPGRRPGAAIILITHDLGVVAEMCDRVAVMYAGEIVEQTDVRTLFSDPRHPYTRGLIGAVPVPGEIRDELATIPGSRAQPHRAAARLSLRAALHGPRGARQRPRGAGPSGAACRSTSGSSRALLALPPCGRQPPARPRPLAGGRGGRRAAAPVAAASVRS